MIETQPFETMWIELQNKTFAHPGNRTPVSTVGGYYDTTTPDALDVSDSTDIFIRNDQNI